jgi:parvulin-like peptidyl-prolyl isomerase
MRSAVRAWWAAAAAGLLALPAPAQQPPQTPPKESVAAPKPADRPTGVAATVNGQPVAEVAVQRGLKRVPPARQDEARPAILNYLIDNLVIDQYLLQLNVQVDAKEVDARFDQVRTDIRKLTEGRPGQTYEKVLEDLMLTEAELKAQITADLRWDRYVSQQGTDKALRDFFEANKEVFDGSMVRARHILLTPASNDQAAGDKAKADLLLLKQQIEQQVTAGMAKQPPGGDALAKEQARVKLLDEAFAAAAREKSACPSKAQGGDVEWFPRSGGMVEPFARAAFSLKPYQLSDVVQTQFGYHLILVTDRKPGKDTKFEDVKEEVKEVFADRMREALASQLRPRATIAITPSARPAAAPAPAAPAAKP